MRLSCIPFSRYGELFVEIRQLQPTPPAFSDPFGAIPFEFRRGEFWHQKTRVPRLSCGAVCVFLRLAILVEHRLVIDIHTDTHAHTDTGSWHIPRKA